MIAALATLLLQATPAPPPSFAVDEAAPVKVRGRIVDTEFANPRVQIHLRDAEGNRWRIEAWTPNVMLRAGYSRDGLRVGNEVLIEGVRARDQRCAPECLALARTIRINPPPPPADPKDRPRDVACWSVAEGGGTPPLAGEMTMLSAREALGLPEGQDRIGGLVFRWAADIRIDDARVTDFGSVDSYGGVTKAGVHVGWRLISDRAGRLSLDSLRIETAPTQCGRVPSPEAARTFQGLGLLRAYPVRRLVGASSVSAFEDGHYVAAWTGPGRTVLGEVEAGRPVRVLGELPFRAVMMSVEGAGPHAFGVGPIVLAPERPSGAPLRLVVMTPAGVGVAPRIAAGF